MIDGRGGISSPVKQPIEIVIIDCSSRRMLLGNDFGDCVLAANVSRNAYAIDNCLLLQLCSKVVGVDVRMIFGICRGRPLAFF